MSNYQEQQRPQMNNGGGRPMQGISLSENQKNIMLALTSIVILTVLSLGICYYLGGTIAGQKMLFANMKVFLILWAPFWGLVIMLYALFAATNDSSRESRIAKNWQFYPAVLCGFLLPYIGIPITAIVLPYLANAIKYSL